MPIECFPLISDLNCFKSSINRQLLTVGPFWRDLLYRVCFNLFCALLPCNSISWSGCLALHGVNPNFKKSQFQFKTFHSRKGKMKIFKWKKIFLLEQGWSVFIVKKGNVSHCLGLIINPIESALILLMKAAKLFILVSTIFMIRYA